MRALLCLLMWSGSAIAQTPTTIGPLTITANSAATVVPATAGGWTRSFAKICNYTTVGGSNLFCRSDGGTPANNLGLQMAPWSLTATHTCEEWAGPTASSAAINCACIGLTSCTVSGEYSQ